MDWWNGQKSNVSVSIKRKLILAIMLTSSITLLVTSVSFITYEVVAFKQTLRQYLKTLAEIMALNNTANLVFQAQGQHDAEEILSTLKAEPHIRQAALYDRAGNLFAWYPRRAPPEKFPKNLSADGIRFRQGSLVIFQPVSEPGRPRYGTLYIRMSLEAMWDRLKSYAGIVLAIMISSTIIAYALSATLQKRISRPILALVATARAVSSRRDYSARAPKLSDDEIGALTDAFNLMLTQIHDEITARKQAQDEILRLNAELEERVSARTAQLASANRELEAFSYSVSHDLRGPLRHIDAYSKILEEECGAELSETAREYIRRIQIGVENMGRLVDDLLNLARLGRQELVTQPADLNRLVEQVIEDLKDEFQHRQIEWQIHPLPSMECDPGLMKQVFMNLISNAIKYTRPRPIARIEIGVTNANPAGPAFFVRDNGVGFSMKHASKLFRVFQRLHRTEDFEGTGVGLATVERIIRKHGGRVWAEAQPDQGATFYFTLPSRPILPAPQAA